MTQTHVELRSGAYADSVTLLQVSKQVAAAPGVEAAQVAMATELNLDTLATMGFEVPATSPNDMVVALRLSEGTDVAAALAAVDQALADATRRPSDAGSTVAPPRTVGSALGRDAAASLALVSVPGEHAFVEAMDAVDAGRDVMVFSDNVPVEQEVALKQAAERAGVLVMGPDCGTALVDGLGLGFANSVRPGPVGIVAASGTGCQQLMTLLETAGVGVRAALGVGGRDLSSDVGGLSTRQALRLLDADPGTELVVVVSKPPAQEVADALVAFAGDLSTPVQMALLGDGRPDLTAAAESVLTALGLPVPTWPRWDAAPASGEVIGPLLRGLFVGGTLCDEAMLIAREQLGPIHSNIPLSPELAVDGTLDADGHVMVDFGDDTLTRGRAHPMIDPTLRNARLAEVAADPRVGVVLMDVVLGHGAEDDPAAGLAPAVRGAIATASADGRRLDVVVACVGTELDPQGLTRQAEALAAAGATVLASNAEATRLAVSLLPAAVTTGGAR
ncbi:FdrA family protein [Solicola sp. PLA-1-18]|uniref:FdrA family protein n=1 Tax=Solicola sp. PLA-1-18 TaxID=3380532 RepID=UPI003B7C1619